MLTILPSTLTICKAAFATIDLQGVQEDFCRRILFLYTKYNSIFIKCVFETLTDIYSTVCYYLPSPSRTLSRPSASQFLVIFFQTHYHWDHLLSVGVWPLTGAKLQGGGGERLPALVAINFQYLFS